MYDELNSAFVRRSAAYDRARRDYRDAQTAARQYHAALQIAARDMGQGYQAIWTSMPTMLYVQWVMMFTSNWAQGCGTRMKIAMSYTTLAVKFRLIGFVPYIPSRT